jgi:hypothetical protein
MRETSQAIAGQGRGVPAVCPMAALARGTTACCSPPGLWGGRRAPWCTRLWGR